MSDQSYALPSQSTTHQHDVDCCLHADCCLQASTALRCLTPVPCPQVLGNIHVGEGAQIAAGSLVLKPVEPHTMVAGSPARMVGTVSCCQLFLYQDRTGQVQLLVHWNRKGKDRTGQFW
jgi:hypothetical protein